MNIKNWLTSPNVRTNTIKINVLYGIFIRGVNIIISFLMVPLTINYINPELYGIWLSLSSIVTWFSFFDIGFGLGLRNKLTSALAYKQYKYGKILVSTTYAFMIIIFTIVGLVSFWGCTFIDWAYLLNISPHFNAIVTTSFQIVVIAFCLRMILQLITNVCQAYQLTALASAIDMVGHIISLIFLLILISEYAPSLILLSTVLCLAPIIAFLIANILLFGGKFYNVSPSLKYVRRFVLRDIYSLGGKFFLIQIICVLLYQATNFIVSHFCGPEQVTVYNIAYKYLNVALMVFTIIQSPIWSAFNDAYAVKDYDWMRNVYRKLVVLMILGELSIIVLIIISPIVYKIWIGDSVYVPFHITVLLGVYTGVLLINNIHAMIINGMGVLKLQTYIAWIQGIVFIPLVYFMAINFQIEGILISLLLVALIPSYFTTKQVLENLRQTAKGIYIK